MARPAAERSGVIGLGFVYGLLALMFVGVAGLSALDGSNPRRWRNTAFYALWAASFALGDRLGDLGNGVLVLALVGLAVWGLGKGAASTAQRSQTQAPLAAWRLFLPALAVPAVALAGSLALKSMTWGGRPLVDPKQVTVVSLGLGVLLALAIAWPLLKPRPLEPVDAARGLFDQIGWAAMLPQTLASLGAVFALAGVGTAVGEVATRFLPLTTPIMAVVAYTVGMALFTVVMGNAFAAFPVMTAAIGAPLLIGRFHADPAVMGAVGMLSGFCGTLVSPLAANFNIVPVALLDLPDRWAVIRVQAPTAAVLLIANTALMYLFAFPR